MRVCGEDGAGEAEFSNREGSPGDRVGLRRRGAGETWFSIENAGLAR